MKRSIAQSILMKQSGPYKAQATTSIKITAIKQLKSFPGAGGFISQDVLDAQADLVISGGYSKKRNPICSSCFTARANNGSCGCS